MQVISLSLCLILSSLDFQAKAAFTEGAGEEARPDLGREMSFDQIVNDLHRQVQTQSRAINKSQYQGTAFSLVTIHSSFGFTQGINTLRFHNDDHTRFHQGLLLAVGVDLFHPQWMAEGVIKNFGKTQYEKESLQLREFDLRLNYRQTIHPHFAFRIFNGLGSRSLKWVDESQGLNLQTNTPIYILGFCLDAVFAKSFSLGIEFSGQTALVSESPDRNAVGLSLKFDNYF